jgi:hypothetical protein
MRLGRRSKLPKKGRRTHRAVVYSIATVLVAALFSVWRAFGGFEGLAVKYPSARARQDERSSARRDARDESTLYAYVLQPSDDAKLRPRPNHWFHFIEYHLPIEWNDGKQAANDQVSGLVLILPQRSWVEDLTPMTRFFLAAAYLKPFVVNIHANVDNGAPQRCCDVFFSSREDLRREDVYKSNYAREPNRWHVSMYSDRAWAASTDQQLEDRFVLNNVRKFVGTGSSNINLTASFVSPMKVDSGTGFGRTYSPVREWFATTQSVEEMRQTFETLCQTIPVSQVSGVRFLEHGGVRNGCLAPEQTEQNKNDNQYRRAVIYQRNVNRKFIEFDQMESDIVRVLGPRWTVTVIIHDDDNPPCVLLQCLKETDLFITPHGFQSMLTMFLPVDAYMFEVFPTRYFWTGYKALSLAFGVRHVWAQSRPVSHLGRTLAAFHTTERCMHFYFCRYLARKGNVFFDQHGLRILRGVTDGEKFHERDVTAQSYGPSRGESLISCVSHCEQDDACFAMQLSQDCIIFSDKSLLIDTVSA